VEVLAVRLIATATNVVITTTPESPTWWGPYIPWLALGMFVLTAVLTAAFLPSVLKGGLSKVAVMKAMASTMTTEQASGDKSGLTAPSTPAPASGDADTSYATAATWGDLDLSMFDEAEPPTDAPV
jgi:hypothetical protein